VILNFKAKCERFYIKFCGAANDNGDISYSTLIVFVKNAKFCKVLERLETGDKTKMELILTRINRVHSGGKIQHVGVKDDF
jgi:hypothetical protein